MSNTVDPVEKKQTRREMCRSLVRYLALGGMGLVWAGLYARSARSPAASCCILPSCSGCTQFEKCDLPQAAKTKNSGQSGIDDNASNHKLLNRGQIK